MARKKFRETMKDELLSKAPGMKFGVDVTEKPRPLPTVIHALGESSLASYSTLGQKSFHFNIER